MHRYPFPVLLFLFVIDAHTAAFSAAPLGLPGGCPSAGIDQAVAVCSGGAPFTMSTSGDPGGFWLDPTMHPHSPVFTPGIDLPGCYRYVIEGTPPCANDTAMLCINTVQPPNAGPDNAIALCGAGGPIVLSTGGDPGGVWTDPNGAVMDGIFDPGVDPAGCYLYTLPATPSCVGDQAMVCITVMRPPDAGLNANASLCVNSPPVEMITLLGGTPDLGGTWAFATIPTDPIFDPATDVPGCATYTVAGQAPCPNDVATLCISVRIPNPGTNGALTLCETGEVHDLSGALGGSPDPNGTWTDPQGQPFDGFFDPAVQQPGSYWFHAMAGPDCVDSSMVLVSVTDAPWAGFAASDTVCSTDGPIVMFDYLGGGPDPGGMWRAPTNAPHSGIFDPDVDAAGCYTYVVQGMAPCPSSSAVLCVFVQNCSVGIDEPAPDRIALQLVAGADAGYRQLLIAPPVGENVTVDLIDGAGRTLQRRSIPAGSGKQLVTLDLSGQAAGIYTVRATSAHAQGYLRFVR